MKKNISLIILIVLAFHFTLQSQNNYPPRIENAREVTYKIIDGVNLNLWIFNPPKHQPNDKKPAIVFFFGGGWNAGSPTQVVPHCEYLAARGIVAMVADYRVKSRNGVVAYKCVSDAKSAVRWIREHATELGIDPARIAAGGGSAGGHLAAATATLSDFDEPIENKSISSKPNALALFNPALVLAQVNETGIFQKNRLEEMKNRMGVEPIKISPYHHIVKGLPPTIIFHGTGDTTVPFETVQLFTDKMNKTGNNCRLVGYKGESHGFFNYGKGNNGAFIDSLNKLDKFLVSLGYLDSPPKTEIYQ